MMRELGVKGGIAGCLVGLGSVAAGMHQAGRGIRLLGAADELLKGVGAVLHPEEIVLYEQGISSARSQLDEAEVEKGWAEGRAMTLDQIMSLVVDLR
jgi:hypothetical protein